MECSLSGFKLAIIPLVRLNASAWIIAVVNAIIYVITYWLSPPQRLLLAMINIEIHFTTLYMADLGKRAERETYWLVF
jgi:hypothetical protein